MSEVLTFEEQLRHSWRVLGNTALALHREGYDLTQLLDFLSNFDFDEPIPEAITAFGNPDSFNSSLVDSKIQWMKKRCSRIAKRK